MVKCKKCDVNLFISANNHKMMCPKCREVTILEAEITQETCDSCGNKMSISSSGDTLLCNSCGQITPYIKSEPINDIEREQKEKIDPLSFPSVTQMGKNLASSVFDYAKSGFKNTDDEKYEKRLEVCGGCESFEHSSSRCRECGCFMEIKAKMESAKCPLGKWKN